MRKFRAIMVFGVLPALLLGLVCEFCWIQGNRAGRCEEATEYYDRADDGIGGDKKLFNQLMEISCPFGAQR